MRPVTDLQAKCVEVALVVFGIASIFSSIVILILYLILALVLLFRYVAPTVTP